MKFVWQGTRNFKDGPMQPLDDLYLLFCYMLAISVTLPLCNATMSFDLWTGWCFFLFQRFFPTFVYKNSSLGGFWLTWSKERLFHLWEYFCGTRNILKSVNFTGSVWQHGFHLFSHICIVIWSLNLKFKHYHSKFP